jgi:hypothetical protein
VFAVVGSFVDFSGDAQTCIANQEHRVLLTFNLTQAIIDRSPPGLIVTPGDIPERQASILIQLLEKQKTLEGRTVAVLGDTTESSVVNGTIVPALRKAGIKMGSTAILDVGTSGDTTAGLAQLDSFIEKWKTEHVNALILVGAAASSKQFVNEVKADIPDMQLIADTTSVLSSGQDDVKAHINPNPYDGIITAEGRVGLEHSKTPHFKYCNDIYRSATGQNIPLPNVVVKLANGKQNDIYGNAEDACSFITMFQDVADRVGKNLNDTNWTSTVNNFGPIQVMNTDYASLHTGKYDADDTYGLVQFDPSLAPIGNWKHLTPIENVSGY